ncbi:MAG: SagB/ThcOx family dehydrogenase [Blautia sp.]
MNEQTRYEIMKNRELLKGYHSGDVGAEATDQEQKLPPVASMKKGKEKQNILLPSDFEKLEISEDIRVLFEQRKSRRTYAKEEMTQRELSFLLWASQGTRKLPQDQRQITFRMVPSAGSRHPFETYLFVNYVEGLKKGIYHYLPEVHGLELYEDREDFEEELTQALCGQKFAAEAPVLFVWSALPYRTEWRYGKKAAKYILLDAGHVCENLYLACEAINCGTCAIGSYDQEGMDELLGFMPGPSADREYECVVYAAPVGKRK